MKTNTFATASEMGSAAAQRAASRIRELAMDRETVPLVFATGASQLETLRALTALPDVPWRKVIGFHLDEYVGLSPSHSASFRNYLRRELVSKVPLRAFYEIEGDAADPEAVCQRYAGLWRSHSPVLALAGIGENGHLAFNDPPVADFEDPKEVKVAQLDDVCRQQQVEEGWFGSLADVPLQAVTVTIPTLMRIPELILSVPGARKKAIVRRVLAEQISTACPATILRRHGNVNLYLDRESSAA